MPRSSRGTSIGSSVPLALSANTSATPNRNIVTSTTVTSTHPVTIATQSTATTTARNRSATTTSSRRSTRSAIAPAHSPNSSHGSRWRSAAIATRTGLRVCEATSSGPAARPIPSPRFEVHDDASSHRKPVPMRGGATTSRMRPTRPRTYSPDAVPSPGIARRRRGTRASSGRLGGRGRISVEWAHDRSRPVEFACPSLRPLTGGAGHTTAVADRPSGRPSGVWPGHQAGG